MELQEAAMDLPFAADEDALRRRRPGLQPPPGWVSISRDEGMADSMVLRVRKATCADPPC